MNAQELLQEISDYCRQTGLAESTFGRRAVNDGKLASRLRHGGRITTETSIESEFHGQQPHRRRAARGDRARVDQAHTTARAPETPPGPRPIMPLTTMSPSITPTTPLSVPATAAGGGADPQRNFRFFDNRQKYLLFVNTCCEKWVVARRVAWSSTTSIRARRRCACSTPASATARCSPASCARCTAASRPAVLRRRQGDQPRGRAPRRWRRCPTASSSIRRRCWS